MPQRFLCLLLTLHSNSQACRYSFGEPEVGVDIIFTDTLPGLGISERSGRFHHYDNCTYNELPANVFNSKTDLLSVLLPPSDQWSEIIVQIVEDATRIGMAEHLYIDDGHGGVNRSMAFLKYRFSALLLPEVHQKLPPQVLLDCMAHHTVPVVDAKAAERISAMSRFFGLAMIKAIDFSPSGALDVLHAYTSEAWKVQTSALRLTQEWLHFRYRQPRSDIQQKVVEMACKMGASEESVLTIFSRRKAFERRMTIRNTWLRALNGLGNKNISYRFIIAGDGLGPGEAQLLERENALFGDLVILDDAPEEYPIGKKGLATIRWLWSTHPNTSWWLKCDDDIYLRPAPIIERLSRSPTGYTRVARGVRKPQSYLFRIQPLRYYWGTFDRSGKAGPFIDPRLLPNQEDTLPPYARGSFLAISMDLVGEIADRDPST
ncbi:UDP-Gal betaGal beta 1,3-galactosyltransferase, polypeptide 6 [Perkinsus chesapeaki]|uniref:Hexosyltransferase n=1 Tax=Perkinsus chesapeaki TaxID=330153 RepID=A0A7J6LNZ0_PERCH|nr:UDP-Gal betaGal beta 1,3-galactosyltransferase, polypeptide 6 [Perkinsus chesapeaki]